MSLTDMVAVIFPAIVLVHDGNCLHQEYNLEILCCSFHSRQSGHIGLEAYVHGKSAQYLIFSLVTESSLAYKPPITFRI